MERYECYRRLASDLAATQAAYVFGRKALRVAEIADQYWCEKQLWLRLNHGQVETEAMRIGSEGHEWASAFAAKVKPEELWREAVRPNRRDPYAVDELHLLAEYGGTPIEGRPDRSLLLRGAALRVVEIKFMRQPHIYGTTARTQIRLYGLLLELAGFDTTRLVCEVVAFPAEYRKLAALEDSFVEEMGGEASASIKRWKEPYDPARAREELEWAIPFWRGEREPVPTKRKWKCRFCDQREACR